MEKKDEREKERHFQYAFYLVACMISVYTVFAEKTQSERLLSQRIGIIKLSLK